MTVGTKVRGDRTVGAVAAAASTAALACGVCCVLPLAIPATMLGSVGGILAWFGNAHRWITPIAIIAVVAGWLWVACQSWRSGKRPASSTLLIMVFATAMVALAYLWPMLEGPVAEMLRP
ncbi:hypothetical protein BH10PSE14_BH10PSE14_20190 [soil metagenome]|uniref:hypothetical protein n=1 Tax=Sphingomonas sp. AR_OL41 TaxID=3042729 RepID=UPI0024806B19|nr:hypothetical protein [Sphingomonas sp. AR_OL41]MDH7972591.1 hypothetical protein [Sphingomonas sp. AR_OL41]